MPRTQQIKSYGAWSRGLWPDAPPNSFPQGSTTDEWNFTINKDLSRERRRGLDFTTASTSVTSTDIDKVTEFKWIPYSSGTIVEIIVVHVAGILHYYHVDGTKYSFVTYLISHKLPNSTSAQVEQSTVSMTNVKGDLIIVGQYIRPLRVVFNSSTSISENSIVIKERDLDGVADAVEVGYQPTTLSAEHNYNLQNQGWSAADIATYFGAVATYPSNSQIWTYGKYVNPATGLEVFSPAQLQLQDFGSSPAPKGRYIMDILSPLYAYGTTAITTISSFTYAAGVVTITTAAAHNLITGQIISITDDAFTYNNGSGCIIGATRGAGSLNGDGPVTVTGATTFTINLTIPSWVGFCSYTTKGTIRTTYINRPAATVSNYGPTKTASFSGRVWYAGIKFGNLKNRIYFSQIITDSRSYEKCYQDADPTSEHISDIIDTDGGYITIPDMGELLQLLPVENYLLVFASNGVWSIGGVGDKFFSATGYTVRNIIYTPIYSNQPAVHTEGAILFLGLKDIFTIIPDKISGFLVATNITVNRITSFIAQFGNQTNNKVLYDIVARRLIILIGPFNDKYTYNTILYYDLNLDAFYRYTFATSGSILGAVNTDEGGVIYISKVVSTGDVRFADFTSSSYEDWFSVSGGDFTVCTMTTSPDTFGDISKNKRVVYLSMQFKVTERYPQWDGRGNLTGINWQSSCLIKPVWDWANNTLGFTSGQEVTNQIGTQFEAYRLLRNNVLAANQPTFDYGYDYFTTKNKIRGHGEALSFMIDGGGNDKACHITNSSLLIEAESV